MEHGKLLLQTLYEQDVARIPFFSAFHFRDRVSNGYETALAMQHGELLLQTFYERDVAHVPFFFVFHFCECTSTQV